MLDVTDLRKRFGQGAAAVEALRGISFDVAEGSFFTLLGPSGCGKTTLLRCVAGLEQPDAGQIRIGGQVMFSSAGRVQLPPEQRPIGMVFQSYAIWPHMTVFDNAAYPLRHGRRRLPLAEARGRVMDMLERLGLEGHAGRWATQLSGGQQQRLALGRALLCEPALLLLDEPLSNLDARLRQSLRGELKTFQRQVGVTTLYVTHDQSEALSLSDRIAVLRDGGIQQIGAPRDLYDRPATRFVAEFLGDANLLEGPVVSGAPHLTLDAPVGRIACRGAVPAGARRIAVAIRPEEVRLATSERPSAENTFPARVVTVEFVGDAVHCTLESGGSRLRARLGPQEAVEEGATVWLTLPADRCRVVEEGADPPADGMPAAGVALRPAVPAAG